MARWSCSCLVALAVGCLLSGCPTEEDEPPLELACPDRTNCDRDFCEQILIPAGEFTMGSDFTDRPDAYWPAGDESPPHQVQLDAFCIDKYEVSLKRYEDCVDDGVCSPDGLEHEQREVQTVVNHYPDECWPDRGVCDDHAVNAKNYFQAQHYCQWMGSRLCTEAEWEFAARGGPGDESRSHPWGNQTPNASLVNIPSVGTGYVEAVNKYGAGKSVHGIYNLAGNVYEWVRDAYHPYEHTAAGETLVDPVYLPKTSDVQVIARGSCFFTEPQQTVTERSKMHMTFDWG